MPTAYTSDQVRALAPDTASLQAAQKLLSPAGWPLLAANEVAAWGLCKGSGKEPYQVRIDLGEPAFKCSCPSRKFPCKHGLALLLLLVEREGAFSHDEAPPTWVTDWLSNRVVAAAKRETRATERGAKPVDPEARADREGKRRATMAAGLEDFSRWLEDLVRHGLGHAPSRSADYWQTPAARLVDAQAPGLAALVRDMHRQVANGGDWPERLLAIAGLTTLAIEGFGRFDELPLPHQADLRAVLGWPLDTAEVLASQGAVAGRYRVLGTSVLDRQGLREQRLWLQAVADARPALILNFAHGSQPLDVSLVPGMEVEADLVYYPSGAPLRAVLKSRHGGTAPVRDFAGHPTCRLALAAVADALAGNPWLARYPVALAGVLPVHEGDRWWLCDGAGEALPLDPACRSIWHLHAMAGGRPVKVFGEWRGEHLTPLGGMGADGYVRFPCEEVA